LNSALVYFRMPMFAFLSGLVYTLRPFDGDVRGFVIGKARRLIVPMLVVGTLFAFLQGAVPGTNAPPIDWRTIHVIPVSHFWFLESMFICFMFVAAFDHFGSFATSARLSVVWALFTLLSALGVGDDIRYFGVSGAVYLMPFVLTGIWYARHSPHVSRSAASLMLLTCPLLIAIASDSIEGLPDKQSPLALVASTVFCIALMKLRVRLAWLAWVGGYSFAIYLFHSMFTAAARIGLYAASGRDTALAVMVLVGLTAGVMGPILLTTLLDRWALWRFAVGESRPRSELPKTDIVAPARSHSTPDLPP
jgi:peptidoglycan/LPS O-acetylase OafA/YrhL